ncbi:MAG: hypothetical protein HKN71_05670, partial [Gemmatimonadetes bacterium]|nr:hypothetical protein [Gemmatimonadota bacterium]
MRAGSTENTNVGGRWFGRSRKFGRGRKLIGLLLIPLLTQCETPSEPGLGTGRVVVSPSSSTLTFRGESVALDAVAFDAAGDATNDGGFSWSSSNRDVATVTGTGRNAVVTAVGQGTAVITASLDGMSGDAIITVAPGLERITLTPDPLRLFVGDTGGITAVATDAGGGIIMGLGYSWTSTDESVATVDGAGLVTAVAAGSTTIRAASGSVHGEAEVIVEAVPVASVLVEPDSASMAVDGQVAYSVRAFDAAGAELFGRAATWAIGDEAIATVDATGVVTGVAAGSTKVTATVEGASDDAIVVVAAAAPISVNSVIVQPDSASILVGGGLLYTVRTFDATGAELFGRPVTWVTGNGSVASVNANGFVTGVAVGSTTVTATVEGVTDAAIVVVTAPAPTPVDSIEVQPDSASMVVGAATAYTARAFDASGAELFGRPVTWTTASGAVATVAANGVVTGVAVGATTVTATVEGVTDDAIVVVTAPPPTPVDSVEVQPDSASMVVGAAAAYTARAFDASGAELFGRAVTWTTA